MICFISITDLFGVYRSRQVHTPVHIFLTKHTEVLDWSILWDFQCTLHRSLSPGHHIWGLFSSLKYNREGRGVSPVPSEAKTKEISGLKIKDWKESTEYAAALWLNLEIYQQVWWQSFWWKSPIFQCFWSTQWILRPVFQLCLHVLYWGTETFNKVNKKLNHLWVTADGFQIAFQQMQNLL